MTLLGFKTILLKKNVGPAKIQRVQQKIPGCWTYVQQNKPKSLNHAPKKRVNKKSSQIQLGIISNFEKFTRFKT
jgi:hypothetical protein